MLTKAKKLSQWLNLLHNSNPTQSKTVAALYVGVNNIRFPYIYMYMKHMLRNMSLLKFWHHAYNCVCYHFQVLAHRGRHWILLQNACRALWNCTHTALLRTHSCGADTLLDVDTLRELSWHAFYMAADCLLDMLLHLQVYSTSAPQVSSGDHFNMKTLFPSIGISIIEMIRL